MISVAADREQRGDGDGADDIHQGRTDGLDADAAQVSAEEAAGSFLEAEDLPDFSGEGFDDAIAGDGFVQDVLDFGDAVLAGAGADRTERPIFRAEVITTGTKRSRTQLSRPPRMMTAATVKRKVKICWRNSPRTALTAVWTRSTSLIKVERMVPVACLWKKLAERFMIVS